MTTSRSTASPSSLAARLLGLLGLVVAALILFQPSDALARRRLVVLDFEGDKAEDFRDEVEKFLKKSHSVVPRSKWDGAAEDLGATRLNDKNVKKVAKKLSIDGVVTGEVEKRSSRYYVTLVLRDGTSGKAAATIELVERSPRFSSDGKATLSDELLPAIDDLTSAGDEGDDEADDDGGGFGRGKAGRGKGRDADGDDDADEDDDRGKGSKAARDKAARDKAAREKAARDKARRDRDEDEDEIEMGGDDDDRVAEADDDDEPGRRGDDDEDVELDGEVDDPAAADPRARPLDLAAGLSFTARRLSFATNLDSNRPLGYKSNPVAGITIAAELFPLAWNRKNRSFTRNLGLTLAFDRVIKMASQIEQAGMVYKLDTTEQHLGVGAMYRHPVGKALTVDVTLRYNKRKFVIDRSAAAMPDAVDIPNVSYTYVDPGVGLRYILGPKMAVGGDARFLLVTDTGAMQAPEQYGGATVTGFDLSGRFDYQVGDKLLVRAGVGLTRIKFSFKGNGTLSNNRDGDPTDTDVSGATDLYFGGALTGVYLF